MDGCAAPLIGTHNFPPPASRRCSARGLNPPPPLVRARCGLQGDDGGAPAWVDAEGKLCPPEIGKAIGGMKDRALANLLAKLKRAAELDGDAQVQVCMLACV